MEINKPISIIVILAIAFTIFFLFTLPKYQESQDLELDLLQKEAQYEARVDYYLKVADILKKIEQNKDAISKVESALPKETDLASIIYFISNRAQASGLLINSVNFSEQHSSNDSDNKFQNIEFKVESTGNYNALKNFMYYLENSARIFEVSSISFSSDAVAGRLNNSKAYDFTLDIQTHTY